MVPASRLGVLRFAGVLRFLGQMAGAIGWAGQRQQAATFQDAIEEGLGEMIVVKDLSPVLQALVGGEDDGPVVEVSAIDDAIEDVGGIVDVGQVADLVDDQHIGFAIDRRRLCQGASLGSCDEFVNEGRRRGEAGVEAVLDGADGSGDGEMRIPQIIAG